MCYNLTEELEYKQRLEEKTLTLEDLYTDLEREIRKSENPKALEATISEVLTALEKIRNGQLKYE